MKKFDDHDHERLLALVEEELDADEAAGLLAAMDEGSAEALRLMQRERRALRSDPEPVMPEDLLERIEPLLARPMLMGALVGDEDDAAAELTAPGMRGTAATRPGEFRRLHRRREVIWRRARLTALAAGLLMVVAAGTWLGTGGRWAAINASGEEMLAAGGVDPGRSAPDHAVAGADVSDPVDSWSAEEATIHHHWPLALPRDSTLAAASGAPGAPGSAGEALTPAPGGALPEGEGLRGLPGSEHAVEAVAAGFMLRITIDDPAGVEQYLERLIRGGGPAVAIVFNFSYDEAIWLDEQWAQAGGDRVVARDAPPQAADGRGPRPSLRSNPGVLHDRADRVGRPSGRRWGDDANRSRSRHIAGPRDLAAPLVDQLEFSARGATHTITLRLSELDALLQALSEATGRRSLLVPMPDEAKRGGKDQQPSEPSADSAVWLLMQATIRARLAEIAARGADPLIHLPVRISAAP